MINKVTLIGNLGADPEITNLDSGNSVAKLSIATSLKYNDKNGQKIEKTEWHRVVAWGRLADICSEYMRKGMRVYVEGRLETRKWTDQSGVDRWATEIIASTAICLDRKPANGQSDRQGSNPQRQSRVVEDVPF